MKPLLLVGPFIFLTLGLKAQGDSCWTVLLHKTGSDLVEREDMRSFDPKGFYLYRNCIYEFKTTDDKLYMGRLIDIKPDTLYFTNFFNENVAAKVGVPLDTFSLYYQKLAKLRLISDRVMGLYTTQSLQKFQFIFKKDTIHCFTPSEWYPIFSNDTDLYELAPHLTAQGVNLLYEEEGATYYFYGAGLRKPDREKIDTTYDVRNVMWYTPCDVEKINGLAIGLHPENMKNSGYNEKDSLTINGLNLHVNPFAIFLILSPHFVGPYSDSIEYYDQHLKKDIETTVNGVNISLVNTINETALNGLNITSLITLVDEIEGCTISGISNFAYYFKGVSIATFYNHATKATGVQIGLVNKSKDLRGLQLGLWNINGRRSLPFINLQFRES